MESNLKKCQLPVSNPTLPFWRTELHELDSFRSTETLPAECDILVVGAGYAAVSTVYHLFEQQCGDQRPSVVMLEAREACSGATARNGGHIKPDTYFNILKYTHKYGAEQAAAFSRFEATTVREVKTLVEKEGIDCDFVLTRAIDVNLDEEHARTTKEAYDELARIGAVDLSDVHYLEGEDAVKSSGVKGAFCSFSFTAAHLWPYKLVMQLLSKLVAKGVNLQTHTPVTSIAEQQDTDGRWAVSTSRGIVKAKKVILATNGYTAAIAPQFHERIVPVLGICSRITAPDPAKAQRLLNTYSLRFGKSLYDYMIARLDGSIVVGGAKHRFWHDTRHWYGVSDDSKLIGPATDYFDGLMQRHFVGWEGSEAATDNVWTGVQGWTTDLMPYVGEVPGKSGQYIIAGFNGHGMAQIHGSSKGLARMIGQGATFKDTGLPAVFEPTSERLLSRVNDILGVVPAKM